MYKLVLACYTDGEYSFVEMGKSEDYDLIGLEFTGAYEDYHYNKYFYCFNFEFSYRSLDGVIKFLNTLKKDIVSNRDLVIADLSNMIDQSIQFLKSGIVGVNCATVQFVNLQPTSLVIINEEN